MKLISWICPAEIPQPGWQTLFMKCRPFLVPTQLMHVFSGWKRPLPIASIERLKSHLLNTRGAGDALYCGAWLNTDLNSESSAPWSQACYRFISNNATSTHAETRTCSSKWNVYEVCVNKIIVTRINIATSQFPFDPSEMVYYSIHGNASSSIKWILEELGMHPIVTYK